MASVFLVTLLFVAGSLVIAWRGSQNDRVAADQNLFHLPVIRQFESQWPKPDLTNYASATAPGYHLLLAAVARYTDGDVNTLRYAGGVFGVLLIAVVAAACAKRSAWLVLPLATSVYVLTSTVWLLPENAGWLLVAIALLLAMHARGSFLYAGSAVTLALLVFVRQSHAWTFLPFLVAALSGPLSRYAGGGLGRGSAKAALTSVPLPTDLIKRPPVAFSRTAIFALLALLPAIAVLTWLVTLWHGLTPPAFRPGSGIDLPLATKVGGIAPAAPAMVLSLVGLFGLPLIAWLLPTGQTPRAVRWAVAGCVIGFCVGVLPTSTYGYEHKSGIWNLVQRLPTVADRSPVIAGLSTLGGTIAALALLRLPPRHRSVLAAALVGFTLAQTANVLVWQRYYEPFVLLWLILAASVMVTTPPARMRARFAIAGLLTLTAFQLLVTTYVLKQG